MKLVDKSAVIAEIERLAEVKPIDEFQPQVQNKIDWLSGKLFAINSLRVFLDTLEVKEVDLEKEFDNYAKDILACDVQFEPFTHLYNCAKHFYELGMAARNKA